MGRLRHNKVKVVTGDLPHSRLVVEWHFQSDVSAEPMLLTTALFCLWCSCFLMWCSKVLQNSGHCGWEVGIAGRAKVVMLT